MDSFREESSAKYREIEYTDDKIFLEFFRMQLLGHLYFYYFIIAIFLMSRLSLSSIDFWAKKVLKNLFTHTHTRHTYKHAQAHIHTPTNEETSDVSLGEWDT